MEWREKIVLNAGEELRHESSRMKGSLQEEDIDTYSIIRPDGSNGGMVTVNDHTAIKGFKRTISVLQTGSDGKTIVETSFSPK